jgi:membrane fusion protein (multidrug efflux system)
MPQVFSRTFRSLDAETDGPSRAVLAVAAIILGLWVGWFSVARLSVYVASDSAHLEVARATHPVDAPVGGRVVSADLALDKEVRAGDVLVVLDSEPQRLALAEAKARAAGIAPQVEATRDTLASEEHALRELSQAGQSAIDVARAKVAEARAAAALARSEADRLETLRAQSAVSEIEALRARAASDQKGAQLAALEADLPRIHHDISTNRDDRASRIAALTQELAKLVADGETVRATIDSIQHDIDRRSIRAPADGKLGEVSTVRVGSVVKEGDHLATVVAAGKLRVVAQLAPASALGRVRAGQLARVRLDGFPWTEFGNVTARVSEVASEVRDNHARVELVILEHSDVIPLQHGMPARVEIEIEKASPLQLVLRAAGQAARSESAPATAAPTPDGA